MVPSREKLANSIDREHSSAMRHKTTAHNNGFSVAEVIIAITIASVFAVSAFQLTTGISAVSVEASSRVTASNMAYNNMRKFANGQKPFWFTCIGDESATEWPSSSPAYNGPYSDAKTFPAATGQVLYTTTSSTPINRLPAPIVQTVVAIAVYGCGESGSGEPIRVQSQVTYGPVGRQRTVTHATYVSY